MQFPFRARQRSQSPVAKAELVLAEEFAAAPVDLAGRRVVSGLIIDDPSAKTLDDAIFARVNSEGYEIVISVADVPAVVPHRSFIDRIARARGDSRFNGDRRMPMLHNNLVESRLSLADKRATLSVVIQLDINFELSDVHFEETVLNRPERTDYASVGSKLDSDLVTYQWITENLRRNRGEQPMEKPSAYAKGQEVVKEFMTMANIALTRYADLHDVALLYRNYVDEKPSYSGHDWGHEIRGESYAQFTSPIRRYADLVNTRQLSAHIHGAELPYDFAELNAIGAELTALESNDFERGPYSAAIQQAADVISRISAQNNEQVLREVEKSLQSPAPHQNAILHALFPDEAHAKTARFGRLALQHMFHAPHLAPAALSSARQNGHASEPVYESVGSTEKGFHEAVTVEISGTEQRGEAIAPNRKLARQLAITNVFAQYVAQHLDKNSNLDDGLGL